MVTQEYLVMVVKDILEFSNLKSSRIKEMVFEFLYVIEPQWLTVRSVRTNKELILSVHLLWFTLMSSLITMEMALLLGLMRISDVMAESRITRSFKIIQMGSKSWGCTITHKSYPTKWSGIIRKQAFWFRIGQGSWSSTIELSWTMNKGYWYRSKPRLILREIQSLPTNWPISLLVVSCQSIHPSLEIWLLEVRRKVFSW